MRFTYAESMCDPDQYFTLAIEAERAGYASFAVPESICYPEEADSEYPYTPDGDRGFLEDKPFIEPFVLMGALGAVTERLRFTTFVVKLPLRHPVLSAKQATSVAVLTKNRFGFGVGISPWPEDFQVMDVPWKARGKRLDEYIDAIRALWTEDKASFHGDFVDFEGCISRPRPANGTVPIVIGGHTEAAVCRITPVR